MLQHSQAFSGFSVDDIEKAREFYGNVLGLKVQDGPMGNLELQFDGRTSIFIYPKPNHEAATYTILNFPVDDIEQAVDQLRAKGVTFEQYTGQIETDEKGISWSDGEGPNIAWFRDPAGNILSVLEINEG